MSSYLSITQVDELTRAAVSGGLTAPGVRDQLLADIHPGYAGGLPLMGAPVDQLLSDLSQMNGVPYLMGYEVPLKKWLLNATLRLQRYARPEQILFQEMLKEVEVKSQDVIEKAKGALAPTEAAPELERVIHQDDTLAYGWLQGAVSVGAAVARLVVTRYDQGQPKLNFSGNPILYMGTGWLFGKQYLITNHHVINARSEGEPNADPPDLRKQAETATVEFDYDAEGADGEPSQVESLSAWVEWNTTPPLDYAILKLKEPLSRTPLKLAPKALQKAAIGTLPVNIVQHPKGHPKRLGIRNNLVSSLEEWELRYFTDTEPGSSGAPVCNDDWLAIALHRATSYVHNNLNFQGKPTAYVNQGVRIDRIIEHLQEHHANLWAAMGVTVI